MIRIEDLKYQVGSFCLHTDFEVCDNEYAVLLGMTGSGKTLLLENLCGLRTPQSGRVLVDKQDVTDSEPRNRQIGYVPQDGALFEHLNVRRNIAFSLEVKGFARTECEARVEEAARLLHITHLLNRSIRGLSGGERQRVALGRALVSQPRALILDEPVSALDEYTRESVCLELKRIQRELKLSVIHVCHSFEEAGLVADRISVMHEGRIVQTGTPMELSRSPAGLPVARILRLKNILEGTARRLSDSSSVINLGNNEITATIATEGKVLLFIRPWEISLHAPVGQTNQLKNSVSEIHLTGAAAEIRTQGVCPITFYLSRQELEKANLLEQTQVTLYFPPSAIHILDA